MEESHELIKQNLDNREGSELIKQCMAKQRKGDNLLKLTQFDKKIKLKQMPRTWKFTRTTSMILKLVETFYYIIISNTQSLIFLSMIASMYQNAGLLTIVYPFLLFGYALLEETRPRKWLWDFLRKYNQVVVLIKFVFNL